MKNSGIGGQAVIEGIMMRNKEDYAIAVRLENGQINVHKDKYFGVIKNKFLKKTPFVRGFFNFIDSMVLGMKTLSWSADQALVTEDDKANDNTSSEGMPTILLIVTVVMSLAFSIGIFVFVPFLISTFIDNHISSSFVVSLFEGIIRLGIFILYIVLISLMSDVKRVYRYHGAEHKCINCIESGKNLTIQNVKESSKEHKRCGTSFLLFVILFSIIIGMVVKVKTFYLKIIIRILLIPVIAGISYEFIKFAGSSNNKVINMLSKPGLLLQGLTVKEPDEDMIEVAIQAVKAVFDEEEFLKTYNDKE